MIMILKFALAFVSTPIIASLLQPFFIRLRLGREKLFVSAAFISLLVLLLREKYGISLYYSDIIAYVSGSFSGLVFLWIWIEQNIRWLKATAANDMFLSEFNIPRDLKLRHLFRFAFEMEDRGADFYRDLAEAATEENVKRICQRISSDERQHEQTLKEMISRWAPLPDDERTMGSLREKVREKGVFVSAPISLREGKDAVLYAIEQEKKLLRFYLGFEKAFPEAWKRAKIKEIAQMERSHIAQLNEILQSWDKTEGLKS